MKSDFYGLPISPSCPGAAANPTNKTMTEQEYQIAKMEYLSEWEGWSVDEGPVGEALAEEEAAAYWAHEIPEDFELRE